MSTVYDVAVVGSRGFLGSAIADDLERRGASVGHFTRERPFAGEASTVVWAVGHVTPADTSGAADALADVSGLIETVRRSPHTTKIVTLSSGGAVYGPPAAAPFSEDDEPSPSNDYGRIKLKEEALLGEADIPFTALRLANPYGAAQAQPGARHGVVGAWMRAILAGEPLTIYGDGSTRRDFVYIDDVTGAIAAAVERGAAGAVNIGSGVGTSLAELLEAVTVAVAPRKVDVRWEPARGIDAPNNWLDVRRARDELGWEPTTPLAEGLARIWAATA